MYILVVSHHPIPHTTSAVQAPPTTLYLTPQVHCSPIYLYTGLCVYSSCLPPPYTSHHKCTAALYTCIQGCVYILAVSHHPIPHTTSAVQAPPTTLYLTPQVQCSPIYLYTGLCVYSSCLPPPYTSHRKCTAALYTCIQGCVYILVVSHHPIPHTTSALQPYILVYRAVCIF